MIRDWHKVGQKIVCINTGPSEHGPPSPFVVQCLEEGKIYTIKEVVMYYYSTDNVEDVAFLLEETSAQVIDFSSILDDFVRPENLKEYGFWWKRFKPLDELKTDQEEKLPALFDDLLKQVNDGLVRFDDEFEEEEVKEREEVDAH